MLRLASDADIDGELYRALIRRQPDLDIVRVQDVGLAWRKIRRFSRGLRQKVESF